MSNSLGEHCGLHWRPGETCECDHHCTGCTHAYGQLREDCCTCCRAGEHPADPDK